METNFNPANFFMYIFFSFNVEFICPGGMITCTEKTWFRNQTKLVCLTCEHTTEAPVFLARNIQILAPVRHLPGHQAAARSLALTRGGNTSTRPNVEKLNRK